MLLYILFVLIKLDLLNRNYRGILSLKNIFSEHNNNKIKSFIKLDHILPNNGSYKHSSKINLNTDAFSVSSQKKGLNKN